MSPGSGPRRAVPVVGQGVPGHGVAVTVGCAAEPVLVDVRTGCSQQRVRGELVPGDVRAVEVGAGIRVRHMRVNPLKSGELAVVRGSRRDGHEVDVTGPGMEVAQSHGAHEVEARDQPWDRRVNGVHVGLDDHVDGRIQNHRSRG